MSELSNAIVKTTLSALHLSGASRVLAPWTRGHGAVLMLHQVNPDPVKAFEPNRILRVTPQFLEAVIQSCLSAGLDFVSLDELRERLVSPGHHRRCIAITLDDAYRDNLVHALPIFRRYGVPYAIYAPTDYIDGRGELWWLALEHILRARSSINVTCAGTTFNYPLATSREKDAAFRGIYWVLRAMDEKQARAFIRTLCHDEGFDLGQLCRDLIMSWDEVRGVAADPLATIGAHTCQHIALAHLSAEEATSEIKQSISRLEAELGRPCRHFSYPYGDSLAAGARDFKIAADVGVATAVTTRKGLLMPHHADALTILPRLSLNGDFQSTAHFKVLMDGVPFAALDAVAHTMAQINQIKTRMHGRSSAATG
jgi:peptidoglycan/xylan/chitin deacetylase (PgdA/CDA1 family)